MGSFVTRRVAETSPDRVARLVLIGSAVSTENPAMREVDEVAQTLEDPLPVEFAREFAKSVIHVPVPPPFFEGVVTENLKAPARVWRDAWDGLRTFDDAAQIGQITAPTLILWGQHDVLFSWEDQQQLLAAVRNVKLIVYPGMGHSPNWERPEQVAADLQAFMSGERPEVSILNPAA